ncbi:MAG: YdeI/OmpD-associated family protein [Chloroflexota bacterium]
MTTPPVFFTTPAEFRVWLEQNHAKTSELLVGFYKKDSGKPSITWPESVDQALCFGWIDGVRKRIDEVSYSIRFTPRKPRSIWSAVNIARVEELTRLGLIQQAGFKAFEARAEDKSAIYAYEQTNATLGDVYEQQFRANQAAWDFFQTQPAWYQKTAIWRVISAKREETRLKRLATLIEDSAQGRTIAQLTRTPKSK